MKFSPCAIVPVYNHGATVGLIVDALSQQGLPIYLVDDGSEHATAALLDGLAACKPLVHLVRRHVNGGKGAAVIDGFRIAWQDGYSHALQVDADGQHAHTDIKRFLEASRQYPDRLICGVPLYDTSVPKARFYGRYITLIFVWLEILSFEVQDAMCGFRVYPLDATYPLINQVHIGARMDFDPEILVRLYWRGVRLINLPTRVIYPEGGLSHFNMLRDNLRISWMHTRLVVGMILRLPQWLVRALSRWRA